MSKPIESIADLSFDDRNANAGTPRGRDMVERSLREYGAGRSVLVDCNGKLIAGNKTSEAAAAIGLDRVRVVQTDGNELVVVQRTDLDLDTDPRARELAISDNRSGELGLEWDADVLASLGEEIDLSTFWTKDELETLLIQCTESPAEPGSHLDEAEELQQRWKTARGQVWEAGRHRVMCGDSTDNADHNCLLSGQSVDMVVTDPPYDLAPDIIRSSFGLFADRAVILSGGKQVFNLVDADWRYCLDFVWRHRQPRSFPASHQPVWYHHNILVLARGAIQCGWKRPDASFGSVIEIEGTEFVDTVMGHGKSTAIFIAMMKGFSWKLWADPFLGTGASVLAADALDVQMFGMELDPTTLAVALQRFDDAGLHPQVCNV